MDPQVTDLQDAEEEVVVMAKGEPSSVRNDEDEGLIYELRSELECGRKSNRC